MTTATMPITRLARKPLNIPKGVEATLSGQSIKVKGPKGELNYNFHKDVVIEQGDGEFTLKPRVMTKNANMHTGTTCSTVKNMLTGVSEGFEKKLQLVGVGYRAKVSGKSLEMTLGYSHPVIYPIPEGIDIATPDQTTVVVTGADKQKVGQVAAELRAKRPPEPYKKKGVRYFDEQIIGKVAKKK